ncbi:hypothetical protein Dimus_014125 [Dionaea muscipula]
MAAFKDNWPWWKTLTRQIRGAQSRAGDGERRASEGEASPVRQMDMDHRTDLGLSFSKQANCDEHRASNRWKPGKQGWRLQALPSNQVEETSGQEIEWTPGKPGTELLRAS